MRVALLIAALLGVLVASLVGAVPFEGHDRVLMLLEKTADKDSFSTYISHLEKRGYKVTIVSPASAPEVVLSSYGEYNYDHLILLAPSFSNFPFATVPEIIKFIHSGGNVILTGSNNLGEATRELATQCGVNFHPENSFVIDHFHSLDEKDTQIYTSKVIPSSVIFPTPVKSVIFEGIGHAISSNELVLSTLIAESTAYSFNPKESITKYPYSAGQLTGLVSSLQAKNNARVTIAGSVSMFKNSIFEQKLDNGSENDTKSFVTQLTEWTFQERGMLRVVNSTHHKVGETGKPNAYRIKDEITYEIDVESYEDGKWVPFSTDDMQIEANMLDTYIRANLISSGNGHFHHTFVLPDVYGVYTFKVSYSRVGRSFLTAEDVVPVQQLRHDQYERFIPAAYPHYISAFSVMITFSLFCFVFLYYREPRPKVKTN